MFLTKDHLYYETNDLGKFTRECFIINFLALRCVGLLVPPPGIEPMPSALEACSLNHWTTREVPEVGFAIMTCVFKLFPKYSLTGSCQDGGEVLLDPSSGSEEGPHLMQCAPNIRTRPSALVCICFHSRLHGK